MVERLCALCATESLLQCINMFDNICEESKIENLIQKYFHIKIQNKYLCDECFKQLKVFHKFYKRIHEAQKIITALKSNQIKNRNAITCVQHNNNNLNNLSIKQKPKSLIELHYNILPAEIYKKNSEQKIESIKKIDDTSNNNLHDNENNIEIIKEVQHQNYLLNEEQLTKINYVRLENETLSKSKIVEEKQENRISFMTQEDFNNIDYDSVKNHDDKITNFMELICTICDEKFPCFNRIIRHYHNIHKIRGYIKCCELKFYTRLELVDHIDCFHLNSNRLTCYLCDKKLGNSRTLRRHMISVHHWKKEELYPCNKCPNTSFSKRVDLKKHKFEVHTIHRYSCFKCKRTFKGETKLHLHQDNIHGRKPPSALVCDLCGKMFKTPGGFYKHTKEIHETKKREECDICGSLAKNLEYHKKMAHPPDGTLIKCVECNKELKTWFALKSHKENYHRIDKKKILCNICDKGFKNQKLLLEHTATHTGQPLYTCTYCPTTFKHESNYLKHKKRQHTMEWAEEKRLKYLKLKDNKE